MYVNKSLMTPSERLLFLTGKEKGDILRFSRDIGLSKPDTLYNIKDGKTPITPGTAEKIYKIFKNINKDWLIKGVGAPYVWGDKPERISIINEDKSEYKIICSSCIEKERLTKVLEAQVEEQKETIKTYKTYINDLRALGGIQKLITSG